MDTDHAGAPAHAPARGRGRGAKGAGLLAAGAGQPAARQQGGRGARGRGRGRGSRGRGGRGRGRGQARGAATTPAGVPEPMFFDEHETQLAPAEYQITVEPQPIPWEEYLISLTHGPPPPSRLAAPESAEPPVHSDMHAECINGDAAASDGGMGLQHKCDGCGHSFSTLQVLYIHASHSVHVCVAVCVIER